MTLFFKKQGLVIVQFLFLGYTVKRFIFSIFAAISLSAVSDLHPINRAMQRCRHLYQFGPRIYLHLSQWVYRYDWRWFRMCICRLSLGLDMDSCIWCCQWSFHIWTGFLILFNHIYLTFRSMTIIKNKGVFKKFQFQHKSSKN